MLERSLRRYGDLDRKELESEIAHLLELRQRRRNRSPRKQNGIPTNIWAGCHECAGGQMQWQGNDALRMAREHHKKTGHSTWCDKTISYRWGDDSERAR